MKNIFLSLALIFVVISCGTVGSISKIGNEQVAIAGTKWVLADAVRGNAPTLILEETKISGNAGCNNYFGELATSAATGTFSVRNIGSTKMACDKMSTERNFLSMLSQADKYVVVGSTLELYKGNLLLMKFNKQ